MRLRLALLFTAVVSCGRIGIDEDRADSGTGATDATNSDSGRSAMDTGSADAETTDFGQDATDTGSDAETADLGQSAMDTGAVDAQNPIDSGPPPTDASSPPSDAGTFDPLTPFDTPTPIQGLNAGGADDPSFTGDLLELFFNRQSNIYSTTRSSTAAIWSVPQPVTVLNSTVTDGQPHVTTDGLMILLSSDRYHPRAAGSRDIFYATRPTRQSGWTVPQPLEEWNSPTFDWPGALTVDRLIGVFASKRGTGRAHLMIAGRANINDPWDIPQEIVATASDGLEHSPWIDPGGRFVYYHSTRSDGAGLRDIWMTMRPSRSSPFSVPIAVEGINTPFEERDPWLTPDLRTIYFSSDRSGTFELYEARR